MKCPKCQSENPSDSNFCLECGSKLEVHCPQCNSELPLSAKFCNKCGHNLSQPTEPIPKELSFDEKLAKIQKYLPGGLTEKILSQRGKIEGERKQVTVMFADMEGFTPLVEKLGAEEAYVIMDRVYEILIHKVHDYEGIVNEMTGDGIMALFGAPIALEDAPQRAIRSAYAIHREMTRFSDKIKQEKANILPLRMRIGIHTGPVVVGTLGNDLRVEFKAVGDTVNLASRMENLAEPGATLVTDETYKLTEGLFRYEFIGEKEVKGKQAPVKIYRVIGPSSQRTRFDVSAERGLTPFVGRGRELELLLEGLERSKQGHGQAFSVISEAGLGKSRLLYEFRKAVSNEDVTFFEGKCLSYSRRVAYHPIIDIYKSNFDISASDEDHKIRDKVRRGLKELDLEESSTLPYLLQLLSVKDSGFDQISMSPEGKKEQIIDTLIRIPLKASEIRPLILAFEDLHWIDRSSEEALKYLLESISGARILLIFTYRPEFVHTWGGRSYHNQINLNRLSNKESLSMTAYLLRTEEIDIALENLILEKTEGVPFYIEQFIKSLQDLKFIDRKDGKVILSKGIQELTIPATIHDVIMARVDALPVGAKEIVQAGSVIEREFSYQLIKRVSGLPEKELLSNLSVLKDSELMFERGIFPQTTLIFKHALAREVIYDSMLTSRKQKLHDDIGRAIEELFKDNIEEYYGILAEHYIASENYAKGAECSRLAGRKAERAVSFSDAIAHAENWVRCLERLPRTKNIEKSLIDARTTLGFYLLQLSHYSASKEAIGPIVDLALESDNKRRIAQIYTILGIHSHFIEDDFPNAKNYLEKAIKMAEEAADLLPLIYANHYIGHVFSDNCEFEKGLFHIDKALKIVEMGNVPWSIAMHKACIAFNIHYYQGKIDIAYETSSDGLRLAEESGDLIAKLEAYVNHGVCCYGKGLLDEAEKHLVTGLELSKKGQYPGNEFLANIYLGEIFFLKANHLRAKECYSNAISIIKTGRTFSSSLIGLLKLFLNRIQSITREKVDNLEILSSYLTELKIKKYEVMCNRILGDILINLGKEHFSEGEDFLKRAIEAHTKYGMKFELGRDYALYSELFKRKEDKLQSKENLNKAIRIFRECGADGWVDKYEKELSIMTHPP